MKRIWMAGALAALLSFFSLCGKAQDKQFLNHLSLGIEVGMNGLGAQLAVPVSPFVQLRGGYSIFPYTFLKMVDTEMVWNDVQLEPFPVSFTLWKGGNGKFLLDFFPGKETPFRLTAGVFFGPGKYIHWEAYWDEILKEEEYAVRSFQYRDYTFSTDKDGIIVADALMKHRVPYVGLGYGRAVNPGKRVRFCADLGVLITGGTRIQTYNFVGNSSGEPVVLRSKDLVTPGGRQLDKGWADRVSDSPVLPMLSFSLFIALF